MKPIKFIRWPLLLMVVFLALAISTESYILKGGFRDNDIKRFSSTYNSKQEKLETIMARTVLLLEKLDSTDVHSAFELLKDYNELFEKREMSIIVTKNNSPIYWSDHVVGFVKEVCMAGEGFVQLPNGWYVLTRKHIGNYQVHGLILIKYNYKIENIFLQNTFAKGFHLPNNFELLFYTTNTSSPIYNKYGQFLFSIQASGNQPCIYSDLYAPVTLFLIALVFALIVIYRINTHFYHKYPVTKLFILMLALTCLYSLVNYFRFPRSMYMLELFSPKHFAYSSYWSSLGEFIVFSILIFFWSINFNRSFDIATSLKNKPSMLKLSLFAWLVMLGVLFAAIRSLMVVLILNSSISYAVFRIEEISIFSFLGFLSLGLLFLSFFFVASRVLQLYRKRYGTIWFVTVLGLTFLILLLPSVLFPKADYLRISIFFPIILFVSFYINKRGVLIQRLAPLATFVLIFTLFTLFNLVKYVEIRENKVQETMAINLSSEHDPTAEIYLSDIDLSIKADNTIEQYFTPPFNDLRLYIENKYFSGYLRKYDLQPTICSKSDSVIITPNNETRPCAAFFNEMVSLYGSKLGETDFYFLDNMNGRVTYFGAFEFNTSNYAPYYLFIELNSKLLSEGTGFPELLLPQHSMESRLRKNFSFAKYNKGELVDRGGEYLYALTPKVFKTNGNETTFQVYEGFVHCIYNLGDDSYIIVSRPKVKLSDYLFTFPYVFVFFFILSLLVSIIGHPFIQPMPIKTSLHFRIQLSIIGVVFATLFVVGGGTITYIIAQYRNNHKQGLIDKLNSVAAEIDIIMKDESMISPKLIEFFRFELPRISEVFWTDVNIYDLSGKMVVSSRPEVFEKGLISEQMDNTAFHYMNNNQPTRFLHKEHIAKMEYLSAYVPLINQQGKSIGYINLPYFTKERAFRQEITTFILAFINIYVFLLLASILVAYFISSRITGPLKLIRENLRNVQLGKRSKPIKYEGADEIGMLVSEYNNKVAELALSAELLAKSEREMAWREMAKQIAHEIKNPLTPMKLNIQFLQRSVPEKLDDYTEKVMRITETLIEQIDNLSAIATEFSNFAKMPKAKNEKFELGKRLKEILKLYNYTGQVEISTNLDKVPPVYVFADKEQFARAIINIIRNAIQSIPENVVGKVLIYIETKGSFANIRISDNGKGIPTDLYEKIFVPNFTTRSSGAGLGLAITRSIVENFKGEISFTSEENEGTTFVITIPIFNAL